MEIRDIRCVRLTYPYSPEEAWSWPGGTYRGWTAVLARIETDDGLVGVGEIGDGLPAPDVVPAVLKCLAPGAVGADPRQVRSVLHRMRQAAPTWARRGLAVSVLSGVEAALFDVVGKATGLPAHALLGGARWPTLPVYASGGLDPDPDVLRDELQAYVRQGYRAVKVRIGYGTDQDLAIAETARAAVGSDVQLMFDAGAPYLPRPPHRIDMARLAHQLESVDPYWLEEPLVPEDVAGHARLRQLTTIPIAAGENTRTRHEVSVLLDAGAVDILQTDAVNSGGMIEQLAISTLAAAEGVVMAPHTWGSAPGLMANLHAAFCMDNPLIIEYSHAPNPLRQLLLTEQITFQDGDVALPSTPGLGVELTQQMIDDFPYDPGAGVQHRQH